MQDDILIIWSLCLFIGEIFYLRMIQNRSQTAPCSRNHTRLSSARVYQSNTTNKFSPTPPLAVPRNISTPKTSVKNKDRLHKRATSAPSVSRPHHSNSILDIRGKYFEQNGKTFDMMYYLKSGSPAEDNDAEDVLSASQVSLNNKQLLERRRGLHRRRSMYRSGVSVAKRSGSTGNCNFT